jgi:hypothetical protein
MVVQQKTLERYSMLDEKGGVEREGGIAAAEACVARLVKEADSWQAELEKAIAFSMEVTKREEDAATRATVSRAERLRLRVLSTCYRLGLDAILVTRPHAARADAYSVLADLCRKRGSRDKQLEHCRNAVAELRRALDVTPEKVALRVELALHLITLGDEAEAKKQLTETLKLASALKPEDRERVETTLKNLK